MTRKTSIEQLREGATVTSRPKGFIYFAKHDSFGAYNQLRDQISHAFYYNHNEKMIIAEQYGYAVTSDMSGYYEISRDDLYGFTGEGFEVTNSEVFDKI